jgi:SAM-dependent methyltransferase
MGAIEGSEIDGSLKWRARLVVRLTFRADAENTRLPAASIDRVLCSGMLHHLDLSCALPELQRILAPGGRILAVEALDYNPAIKPYHYLTPDMRTDWEKSHILNLKDVAYAGRFFTVGEYGIGTSRASWCPT